MVESRILYQLLNYTYTFIRNLVLISFSLQQQRYFVWWIISRVKGSDP